eukprot:2922137-Amphidinium_carterae.2
MKINYPIWDSGGALIRTFVTLVLHVEGKLCKEKSTLLLSRCHAPHDKTCCLAYRTCGAQLLAAVTCYTCGFKSLLARFESPVQLAPSLSELKAHTLEVTIHL